MTEPDQRLTGSKRKDREGETDSLPDLKRTKKQQPQTSANNAPLPPTRDKKEKPVPEIPQVDTGLANLVPAPGGRDEIVVKMTDLVQDLTGAETDADWADFLERTGNDIEQKFFSGGKSLPQPGPVVSPGRADPRRLTQDKASDTFAKIGLGPREKGTGPLHDPTGEGIFQKTPNQKGQWKADGEVSVIEGPRNYTSTYDILLAHALSQAFINYLKSSGVEITEIQVMVLDDRIMVSSNEQGIIGHLKGAKLATVFGQPPKSEPDWAQGSQLLATELMNLLSGKDSELAKDLLIRANAAANLRPEQAGALNTILTCLKSNQKFTLIDEKNTKKAKQSALADYVTNAGGKSKIILVDSAPVCHAEQNLLIALALSGYGGASATIAGGKRPCTVCHVAFKLVQKYKYANIRFVQGHGGFWYNSIKGSFTELANALSLPENVVIAEAQLVLALAQYVTSLDSRAAETAEITDIRDQVMKQTVATDHIPAEIEVPPAVLSGLKTYQPDLAELQQASQEEREYKITQSLEIPDSQSTDLDVPPPGWDQHHMDLDDPSAKGS